MRKISILMGFFLCVLASIFFACTKETKENTEMAKIKSIELDKVPEKVLLAETKKGEDEHSFLFDKEKYAILISEIIERELGKDYVFEDISIQDKEPFDLENTPILRHTIFNIETGFTYTSFVVLDKEITEEGNIVYYAKEDTPRRTITCEATNCDGCNFENNNCTLCKNEGGVCKKTDAEVIPAPNPNKIGWKDVIGWVLTAIGIIAK